MSGSAIKLRFGIMFITRRLDFRWRLNLTLIMFKGSAVNLRPLITGFITYDNETYLQHFPHNMGYARVSMLLKIPVTMVK